MAKGNPCFYVLDAGDAWRRSGSDAPCVCDDYREYCQARTRRAVRKAMAFLVGVLIVGIAIIYWLNR